MNEQKNIFGCFVTYPSLHHDTTQQMRDNATEEGDLFKDYIWGKEGISYSLKVLNNEDYGQDLKLALFQFYLKPIPYLLQQIKEIESYRKTERSIGIPIIVTEENFFGKSEEGRQQFLRQSIFQKLELLAEVVKKKKLDTNVEQLRADLQKILK